MKYKHFFFSISNVSHIIKEASCLYCTKKIKPS